MSHSPAASHGAHAVDKHPERQYPEKKQERKQRLLKHGATALVGSIADAIIIKDQDLFLVVDKVGSIPLHERHGFGLYYHDCRYLDGYQLFLAESQPDVLAFTAQRGFTADLFLTNPDIRGANESLIRKEQLGVYWRRTLDDSVHALHDEIHLQNYSLKPIEVPITFRFRSQFEDIFEVRGAEPETKGHLREPRWDNQALLFRYDGADGIFRTLSIEFSTKPYEMGVGEATFHVQLNPRQERVIELSIIVGESRNPARVFPKHDRGGLKTGAAQQNASDEWVSRETKISSDSLLFNDVLERSFRDLAVLRSSIDHQEFFAAGIPWFATLFGRDSLITAIQTLAFNPDVAEETLRLLARYQGTQVDEWRDEEPGKILHELRVGEMAHLGQVPMTPYYGSVDSTPLFLILMSLHSAWTGSTKLFTDLKSNVQAALDWIDRYGDLNHDGYLEYASRSKHGLSNQGWKDSGDSIINADGQVAEPPIALVEVQGYVYAAKMGIADLNERTGDKEAASKLREQAAQLKRRFNRDFWMEEEDYIAIALEGSGRAANVVSSNAGQALWTGIVDDDKARPIAHRLMSSDMFTEWGIRTLSDKERRYNPIGYHLGTVWPHDNSIIAAGLRRYGFDESFMKVYEGILAAAMGFRFYRLPELFAGFDRKDFAIPVRYPVACHPQAWAAGSMPFLVQSLLGLVPDAFDHRLRVVRPQIPKMLNEINVQGLRIGAARVDLHLTRSANGRVHAETIHQEGQVQVVIE